MAQNGSSHMGGYVDPNFPNPKGIHDAPIVIYGYTPSFVLAVLAIITFLVSFIAHTYQVRRYRTWYFVPFAVGTGLEVVGYAFRALSASKYLSLPLNAFIASS
jgi:hypothetical protein